MADPKVTSILSKQRGEKGYRVHQGDKLRTLLSTLIEEEVQSGDIDISLIICTLTKLL